MESSDILYFYYMVVVYCVILLFFVYLVARKKKASDALKEGILKKWVETGKNQYYFEVVFRLCMLLVVVWYFGICIPYFKDISYARNKDFNIVTGITKSQDHSRNNTVRKRYLTIIENETNKEIRVEVLDRFIDIGEIMTVVYLPNTRFGSRIQKEEFK